VLYSYDIGAPGAHVVIQHLGDPQISHRKAYVQEGNRLYPLRNSVEFYANIRPIVAVDTTKKWRNCVSVMCSANTCKGCKHNQNITVVPSSIGCCDGQVVGL